MNKTLREYLDIRHPELWDTIYHKTRDYLDSNNLPHLSDAACEYATWHRAYTHSSDGIEFYENAGNDEVQNARLKISSLDLSFNPYELMNRHNFHILIERWIKSVKSDLEKIQEILDADTWDENTDLQKEVNQLRKSAEEIGRLTIPAEQLWDRADELESEASHWLEIVTNLIDN